LSSPILVIEKGMNYGIVDIQPKKMKRGRRKEAQTKEEVLEHNE